MASAAPSNRDATRLVRSTATRQSVFFFFSSRRRHTRLQGDWSSDVCSSDLTGRNFQFLYSSHMAGRLSIRLQRNLEAGLHAPSSLLFRTSREHLQNAVALPGDRKSVV